jgi:hypothetical protein
VTEVPFKFAPRRQGISKGNLMTAVHYLSLLWRLTFKSDEVWPKKQQSIFNWELGFPRPAISFHQRYSAAHPVMLRCATKT